MERVFWRGIRSIFSEFERLSPLIVDAGLIESSEVEYVLNGLRNGVDLCGDESKLQGKRVFRSYKNVQNIGACFRCTTRDGAKRQDSYTGSF